MTLNIVKISNINDKVQYFNDLVVGLFDEIAPEKQLCLERETPHD